MKQRFIELSRRYVAALRKHLQGSPPADLQPALRLGRQAVTLRLETLELARIHEQAATTLKLSTGGIAQTKQAEIFFTEALTPILATHRAARESQSQLNRLTAMLNRRTAELVTTNQQLKHGVARRKNVEAALKKSGRHFAKLLKDSLHLQEGLRQVTRQVIVAQEEERRKMSCELQDEVAQALLGINVRLITLKREARSNTKELQSEVGSAQRLVGESVRSARRAARKLREA